MGKNIDKEGTPWEGVSTIRGYIAISRRKKAVGGTPTNDSVSGKKVLMDQIGHFWFSSGFETIGPTD